MHALQHPLTSAALTQPGTMQFVLCDSESGFELSERFFGVDARAMRLIHDRGNISGGPLHRQNPFFRCSVTTSNFDSLEATGLRPASHRFVRHIQKLGSFYQCDLRQFVGCDHGAHSNKHVT